MANERDYIRSFVNDPGRFVATPDLAPAERTLPPRSAEDMVRRQRARDIARARSSGGLLQEPVSTSSPSREEVRQTARERSAAGLRLQPSATPIQEATASPVQAEAVTTEPVAARPVSRAAGPTLRPTGTEGRQFEFTPGAGRGLRGEVEFDQPQSGFEDRVRQSVAAGAFDPVTPERVESARQVHQANIRGLRAMRQLSAARLGVPEQFLDAVRQGHLTGREAATLGAQQPVARGEGGLTTAEALRFQQGERAQGLRERQFAFDRQQETNRMLTDEEPAVRNEGRRQAAADYANNPGDPIAQETMARAASRLLNDLGNPSFLSEIWFDRFGGTPQTLLDDDTKASVSDMISGEGLEIDMDFKGRGKPVLIHRGNPVDEWEDVLAADPDIAMFLLDAMGIPRRQRQRGFRQR